MRKILITFLALVSSFSAQAMEDPRATSVAIKILDGMEEDTPPRFGFSLGMGALHSTGNRGLLWQTGTPMYDLAIYYWIAPQLSLHLEGSTVTNYYESSMNNGGHVDVNIQHAEIGTRYYSDANLLIPSIPSGVIRPFASLGLGAYSMKKSSVLASTSEYETQIGMSLGGGLHFEVIRQRLGLELMGRWNSVQFQDTNTQIFQISNNIDDLSGQLISWNVNALVSF